MSQKRANSSYASKVFNDPNLRHPTAKRAKEIDDDLPIERLKFQLNDLKGPSKVQNVLHWFRTKDLRAEDNRGLHAAASFAKEKGGSLLALFVIAPKELDWHGVGDARRAFLIDSFKALASQLKNVGVPLVPVVAESRAAIAKKVVEFVKENNVSHVFGNFEYEFDEINRDIKVASSLKEAQVGFQLFHDQTVVEPGVVTNNNGEPRKVFTSFWNGWIPLIAKDPKKYYLEHSPVPEKQEAADFGSLFEAAEKVDLDKALGVDRSDEHLKRIAKLWPIGHDAAVARLHEFAKKKILKYGERRSNPADDCVSRMSPYFAVGVISVREALAIVRKEANGDKNFGTSSSSGVDSWVREIAFREFYRQMTASVMPHIVMNMPSSLKLTDVEYEQDEEAWKRWCEGKTGLPFVDAGMRQLNTEGYMHNRLRMNVASYLKMNYLLDFRLGLRYFANKLVDWDCSNNAFGWDPSYTVFNPVLQAERLDPDGEYIRRWLPELKDVQGKAIFDPANRLSAKEFAKLDYPKPMIEQQAAKERSTERFKQASRGTTNNKRVKQES